MLFYEGEGIAEKRRKHRFWVRAIYQRREQLGLYKTLVQELKHEDRENFFRYL